MTISEIFATRHDSFRDFCDTSRLLVHVTEFVIKRHKSVVKCHDHV